MLKPTGIVGTTNAQETIVVKATTKTSLDRLGQRLRLWEGLKESASYGWSSHQIWIKSARAESPVPPLKLYIAVVSTGGARLVIPIRTCDAWPSSRGGHCPTCRLRAHVEYLHRSPAPSSHDLARALQFQDQSQRF